MNDSANVLAVMDRHVATIEHEMALPNRDERVAETLHRRRTDALEARAAVAALIEAAIEANTLLEIVAMIQPWDQPQEGSTGHKLRTAIAKATGEPR